MENVVKVVADANELHRVLIYIYQFVRNQLDVRSIASDRRLFPYGDKPFASTISLRLAIKYRYPKIRRYTTADPPNIKIASPRSINLKFFPFGHKAKVKRTSTRRSKIIGFGFNVRHFRKVTRARNFARKRESRQQFDTFANQISLHRRFLVKSRFKLSQFVRSTDIIDRFFHVSLVKYFE